MLSIVRSYLVFKSIYILIYSECLLERYVGCDLFLLIFFIFLLGILKVFIFIVYIIFLEKHLVALTA